MPHRKRVCCRPRLGRGGERDTAQLAFLLPPQGVSKEACTDFLKFDQSQKPLGTLVKSIDFLVLPLGKERQPRRTLVKGQRCASRKAPANWGRGGCAERWVRKSTGSPRGVTLMVGRHVRSPPTYEEITGSRFGLRIRYV